MLSKNIKEKLIHFRRRVVVLTRGNGGSHNLHLICEERSRVAAPPREKRGRISPKPTNLILSEGEGKREEATTSPAEEGGGPNFDPLRKRGIPLKKKQARGSHSRRAPRKGKKKSLLRLRGTREKEKGKSLRVNVEPWTRRRDLRCPGEKRKKKKKLEAPSANATEKKSPLTGSQQRREGGRK